MEEEVEDIVPCTSLVVDSLLRVRTVHVKLVKEVLLALLKLPMWQKQLLNTAFNVGKQHGYIGVSLYAFGLVPLTNSIEDVIGTERAYDFFHWLGSKSIGVWRLSHHYEEKCGFKTSSLQQPRIQTGQGFI
ncbi:hypothetical protein LWI28_000675 [Acer negundo]|uniref:Uncharacterized protein n=1 Tax=Acer negundo TaxID=4023 RepID=A0AAD5NTE5_ACENE|nr:hypothetical protein LWI28_000675 [Acer negundo]